MNVPARQRDSRPDGTGQEGREEEEEKTAWLSSAFKRQIKTSGAVE